MSRPALDPLWSHAAPYPLRGLALAREPEHALVWDGRDHLFRLGRKGEERARAKSPAPLVAACAADDGLSFAGLGPAGQVWLFGPDLRPRWEHRLGQRGLAVALAPLGELVAASDAGGGLHVLDAAGRLAWRATTPRPLHFLAFVPERPVLVGSADLGLVCGFGPGGQALWRDGLVSRVGGLAVTGDGATVALACFSDGLVGYAADAGRRRQIPAPPCRLVALSYTGETVVVAGLDERLCVLDAAGAVRAELALEGAAEALAVSADGERALAVAGGKALAWKVG